ncbi:hypothetical protein RRF57_000972 [Xylaria bambusicola]|uniref:Uncharacterized protein n=1 Tax=Xylaria bambusicola TaxID=326684 RepID=A0AAN7UG88_9PEZI
MNGVTRILLERRPTPEACTPYSERFYAVRHLEQPRYNDYDSLTSVHKAAETVHAYSQWEFGGTAYERADSIIMDRGRQEETGQPLVNIGSFVVLFVSSAPYPCGRTSIDSSKSSLDSIDRIVHMMAGQNKRGVVEDEDWSHSNFPPSKGQFDSSNREGCKIPAIELELMDTQTSIPSASRCQILDNLRYLVCPSYAAAKSSLPSHAG